MYAHRAESPHHVQAIATLRALAEGPAAWALPIFVLSEFLRVVTHPRVLDQPSSMTDAIDALEALLESPTVQILSPGAQYWGLLRKALADGSARGNLVFDAQIVAVCREHGADTILSEDRDLRRFDDITVLRLDDAVRTLKLSL